MPNSPISKSIALTVNGNTVQSSTGIALTQFLESVDLVPQQVVVELNGQALSPHEFQQTLLNDGDRLEIVNIVAGG